MSGGRKKLGSRQKSNGRKEASERTINTSVIQIETKKLGQRQWVKIEGKDKTRNSNVLG